MSMNIHTSLSSLVAVIVCVVCVSTFAPVTEADGVQARVPHDPAALARLVGNAMLRSSSPPLKGPNGWYCPIINEDPCGMMRWNYGGALIMDGMYEAAAQFGYTDWHSSLDEYLDGFVNDPSAYAYFMARNITQPFDHAVGDQKGLYPIAYLRRAVLQGKVAFGQDINIARFTADNYILKWPHRLADGTFSRLVSGDWPGEKSTPVGSFVWGDDQTMGTVLVARMAPLFKNRLYSEEVTRQQIGFAKRLRDPTDGLNYHGYNDADGHVSCCKWSRANGWGMLGHAEAIQSMQAWPAGYPNTTQNDEVIEIFKQHAAAAKASQASDGRWHQLLNDSSAASFLETSTTAMFVSAIARGIRLGILDNSEYAGTVRKGWAGLVSTVLPNGTVTGVCCGTGIQPDAEAYYERSTFYGCSGPGGAGAVLYAAVDVAKLNQL